MVRDTLERPELDEAASIQFACHECGAVLSVPLARAGVSGPCPCCGEWLESPGDEAGRWARRAVPFVSRRPPVAEVRLEPLPKLRPEGRINWRERRDRCDDVVSWFRRSQATLCMAALVVAGALMLLLYSHGWNLPWNLSEDSAVVRFLESMRPGGGEDGPLPTGPARRK